MTWLEAGLSPVSALAVVAHPDDESFGLGAILSGMAEAGIPVRVLCLTRGEASTLGADGDLSRTRQTELSAAATQLGVSEAMLLAFPDGGLASVPAAEIDSAVEDRLGAADLVVVFDSGGVTGHPDHRAATASAVRVAARRGTPVLYWGVGADVAAVLNAEMGTGFVPTEGFDVRVDRSAQWRAIRCHASQSRDNPVLCRRLALQADSERLRLALPSGSTPGGTFGSTPGGSPDVQ